MTEHIWHTFHTELLGFIESKVSDKVIAEDILQDVFLKIHKNINRLNDEKKLTSWVYQITRNSITDYYRKKKLPLSHSTMEIQSEGLTSEPPQFASCLKPFTQNLPEKYKQAVLQTTFEQKSQKEYAESNSLSYSAAKSRVQRARKLLKEEFIACCQVKSDNYGNIIDYKKEDCSC